jgi:hypothetical protein
MQATFWRVTMGVAGEAFAVLGSGRRMQRGNAGATRRNWRKT